MTAANLNPRHLSIATSDYPLWDRMAARGCLLHSSVCAHDRDDINKSSKHDTTIQYFSLARYKIHNNQTINVRESISSYARAVSYI
jgi:hypothetical protein